MVKFFLDQSFLKLCDFYGILKFYVIFVEFKKIYYVVLRVRIVTDISLFSQQVATAYMYSDFFDPPDAAAAAEDDERDSDGGEGEGEEMDYSSGDKMTGVSDRHSDRNEGDKISDDSADDDNSDDDDVEEPPVKKTKHKLLAAEYVCLLVIIIICL